MPGMDARTGRPLDGSAHLAQSIRDILVTPIGSRVMRRDYGSELYQLVDQPVHDGTVLRLFAATAKALRRWEPRVRIERVVAAAPENGHLAISVYGVDTTTGDPVAVEGVIVQRVG